MAKNVLKCIYEMIIRIEKGMRLKLSFIRKEYISTNARTNEVV